MLPSLTSRRKVIAMGAAGLMHLLGLLRKVASANNSGKLVDWESFIAELSDMAEAYAHRDMGEQRYVNGVCRLLAALDYRSKSVKDIVRQHSAKKALPQLMGFPIERTTHFEVALFSFDKGEYFPLHDHPSMNGACLCLNGEIRVHNLDFVAKTDDASFLLRDRGQETLSAGHVSWLTSFDRNVHKVEASERSQLLDIFTPPYNATRMTQTRWFELERHSGADVLQTAHLL